MNIIYAEYNMYHNSIDIATPVGYILKSLYLDGNIQICIDAEDSLDVW